MGRGARADRDDPRRAAATKEIASSLEQDQGDPRRSPRRRRRRPRRRSARGPAAGPGGSARRSSTRSTSELDELQGEIAAHAGLRQRRRPIAEVISGWTGIPVGKMLTDEIEHRPQPRKTGSSERVIGQDHALEAIAQRIRTARANLTDPRSPIGVFLLVGPSGVGKTETALALADTLYGGERNLITINMSRVPGSAHRLVAEGLASRVRRLRRGRRPDRGGAAPSPTPSSSSTRSRRRTPTSWSSSTRSSTRGMLEDGEGREIDFKNTRHPPDVERRHRHDDEALRRPRDGARRPRSSSRRSSPS